MSESRPQSIDWRSSGSDRPMRVSPCLDQPRARHHHRSHISCRVRLMQYEYVPRFGQPDPQVVPPVPGAGPGAPARPARAGGARPTGRHAP